MAKTLRWLLLGVIAVALLGVGLNITPAPSSQIIAGDDAQGGSGGG